MQTFNENMVYLTVDDTLEIMYGYCILNQLGNSNFGRIFDYMSNVIGGLSNVILDLGKYNLALLQDIYVYIDIYDKQGKYVFSKSIIEVLQRCKAYQIESQNEYYKEDPVKKIIIGTLKNIVQEIDQLLLPREMQQIPVSIYPDVVTGANNKIYGIYVKGETSYCIETQRLLGSE